MNRLAATLAGLAALLPACGEKAAEPVAQTATRPPIKLADKPAAKLIQQVGRVQLTDDPDLVAALTQADRFATGFRRKEETGEFLLPGEGDRAAAILQARARLAAIRAKLAVLSTNEVPTYVLIHSLRPDGHLAAWLIAPDGGVTAATSPAPYAGLAKLENGLDVLRRGGTRAPRMAGVKPVTGPPPVSLAERQRILFETAGQLLPGAIATQLAANRGRLLVLPARDTGSAPYAAFPMNKGVAALGWQFVIMPDVGTLARPDRVFDRNAIDLTRAVIVGDPTLPRKGEVSFPPLPGARAEALAIAELLSIKPAQVMTGDDATHDKVVKAINARTDTGIVYLATHAVSNPTNPLTRGYIALDKAFLYGSEIRTARFSGWDTHHPLVVLSACQTALGKTFEGGGFGVARMFTTAGAGQVVASLWSVDDRATQLLMTRFMKRLVKGASPEAAMQAAQLETWKQYPNDPGAWASFSIYGAPTVIN